jgi:hypothetical protein
MVLHAILSGIVQFFCDIRNYIHLTMQLAYRLKQADARIFLGTNQENLQNPHLNPQQPQFPSILSNEEER